MSPNFSRRDFLRALGEEGPLVMADLKFLKRFLTELSTGYLTSKSGMLLLSATIANAGIGSGHVKGDINCDGVVDVSDINQMINITLDRLSFSDVARTVLEPIGLDVNADGVINEADALRLCDLTGDGVVDVGDLNMIINRALSL